MSNRSRVTVLIGALSFLLPGVGALPSLAHSDCTRADHGTSFLIQGDEHNNDCFGTGITDTMFGYQGADTFAGQSANDTLFMGLGNDTANGNGGADRLFGEGGADQLFGGSGNDRMNAGTGADLIRDDSIGDADIACSTLKDEADWIDLKDGDGNDIVYAQGGTGDDIADTLELDGGDDLRFAPCPF